MFSKHVHNQVNALVIVLERRKRQRDVSHSEGTGDPCQAEDRRTGASVGS